MIYSIVYISNKLIKKIHISNILQRPTRIILGMTQIKYQK